jgi:SAM-dependent methyltransferase
MLDTAFWKRAWEAARNGSSMYKKPSDPARWEAFWDFFATAYARRNRENRAFHDRIVDYLASMGVIQNKIQVLDVGCGPGTYTLPLVRHCRKIVALDTSRAMLTALSNEARREGLESKIETSNRDWSKVPESKAYDLVFGALTPAIRDYDSLMKMNRVSRGFCCLISFKGRYHSTLRDDLWREVMQTPMQSLAFDLQFPFNILYHEGYLPQVAFFPYERVVFEKPDYLKRHYRCYFEIFGKSDAESAGRIDAFIDARSENGAVPDIQRGTLGVIHWPVRT